MGGKLTGQEIFLFIIFSGIRMCFSPHSGKLGWKLGTVDETSKFRV